MLEILKILSKLDPGWKHSQMLAERNSDSGRGQHSGKRVRKILTENAKKKFFAMLGLSFSLIQPVGFLIAAYSTQDLISLIRDRTQSTCIRSMDS